MSCTFCTQLGNQRLHAFTMDLSVVFEITEKQHFGKKKLLACNTSIVGSHLDAIVGYQNIEIPEKYLCIDASSKEIPHYCPEALCEGT